MLFRSGGALVACDDRELVAMLRAHRWKELFWENRERVRASMRFLVLGHAVLEQALQSSPRPRPSITCKALFVHAGADPDLEACELLAALPTGATPRELAPLPVFGYPGWLPESARAEFYDDTRVFRPAG